MGYTVDTTGCGHVHPYQRRNRLGEWRPNRYAPDQYHHSTVVADYSHCICDLTAVQTSAPTVGELDGAASAAGNSILEVQTESGGAFNPAQFDGATWRYSLQFAAPPDGVTYPITARITDGLGRITTASRNVHR